MSRLRTFPVNGLRESAFSSLSQSLLAVVIATGLLPLSGCDRAAGDSAAGRPGAGGGPPPMPAEVYTAARTAIPEVVEAVGSLQSPMTTSVSADRPGILVSLPFREGGWVEKGQVLARIDPAEAEASLQIAIARAENAKAAWERVQPLFDDGVVSRQVFDDAKAELETANGLLAEANTVLGKMEVKAPFSGVLSLQSAQLGQRVNSGDKIVQLVQVDPLELLFAVPESEARRVRIGQKVNGQVGRCGESFTGTVEALDPFVDPATRSLSVQARVANPGKKLLAGMSARVTLITGQREGALMIPREALVPSGTTGSVWVVGEDDTVSVRRVVPGEFLTEMVEIRDGLAEGERIVAAGWQKLRPGAKVAAQPWKQTTNPDLGLGGREENCS